VSGNKEEDAITRDLDSSTQLIIFPVRSI
jgi:hypothetical protein